eukprot:COSAG06_NODE_23643_length_685_cov_12.257679_1_plen_47_part_10
MGIFKLKRFVAVLLGAGGAQGPLPRRAGQRGRSMGGMGRGILADPR